MINYKYLFLLIFLSTAFSGCALGPDRREPPAVFDLGPPRTAPVTTRINTTLLIPAVNAAPSLDSPGMLYRLNYGDAGRTEAYAQNRWAVTPAMMLTERIRTRFAAAARGVVSPQDGARADYALRVELEDFSQSFDAPGASKVAVRLRASLVQLETRTLHAQRTFTAERPAAPNAPGAAKALAEAGDAVVDDLLDWAVQNIK